MQTDYSPAVAFSLSPITLCPVMVCPRNRVGQVKIAGMDSQGIGNLFAGVSALGAIVSAIFACITWRQALGSKEAKAKADEAHKAALDMRDAAQRSAKAAEERAQQAEKSLKQMQQIVAEQQSQSQSQSKIADSLYRPILELTHVVKDQRPNDHRYKLRNISENPVIVLEVKNRTDFLTRDGNIPDLPVTVHPGNPVNLFLRHPRGVNSLDLRIKVSGKKETIFVEIPR